MKSKNTELLIIKEIDSQGVAVCLKPNYPKVISPSLVDRIRDFQDSLANQYFSTPWDEYLYVMWYCHRNQGTSKLGFDFNFIIYTLRERKEHKLETYIKNLVDILFLNYISLGLPIVNCSIIDKKISGVFQEFFYLNKINFIKYADNKNDSNSIIKVDVFELSNHLSLSKSIYDSNIYYQCPSFDLSAMKSMLETTQVGSIDETTLKEIRHQFDEMYQTTLASIYNLASKNPSLLKRLAQMQLKEVE
jgi:hypothetical protein